MLATECFQGRPSSSRGAPGRSGQNCVLAMRSTHHDASASESSSPMPTRHSRPRPISPTVRSSTVTDARFTRWSTSRMDVPAATKRQQRSRRRDGATVMTVELKDGVVACQQVAVQQCEAAATVPQRAWGRRAPSPTQTTSSSLNAVAFAQACPKQAPCNASNDAVAPHNRPRHMDPRDRDGAKRTRPMVFGSGSVRLEIHIAKGPFTHDFRRDARP